MAKIVVIDDDRDYLVQTKIFLEKAGHTVFPLMRAEKAVEEVVAYRPDLVITDIMMPGICGGAVYETLRKKLGPFLPIIICSGSRIKVKTPNDDYVTQISKPVDYDYMVRVVAEMLIQKAEDDAL